MKKIMEDWRGYRKDTLRKQSILLTERKLEEIFSIEDEELLFEEFEKLLLEDAEILAESLFSMATNAYKQAKNWTKEKIARSIQKMLSVLEKLSKKFDDLMVDICNRISRLRGSNQCDPEISKKLKNFGHGFRNSLSALSRTGGRYGRSTRPFILVAGALGTVIATMWMNKNLDPEMIELAINLTREAAEIFSATDPESISQAAGEFVNNADEWADKVGYATAGVVGTKGTKDIAQIAKTAQASRPIRN